MSKQAPPDFAQTVVNLTKEKECKGSIRYVSDDPDAVVTNVYLSRRFSDPMPEAISVTIEGN